MSFFSAVISRCTISPRKHGYEPPKHKMPPLFQNNFFSAFLIFFSVTKAIHSYVLAKFEKIFNFFLFSTPLLDFYRRPLLNTKKQNYPIMKPFEKRLSACCNNQRITSHKGVRKLYTSGKFKFYRVRK